MPSARENRAIEPATSRAPARRRRVIFRAVHYGMGAMHSGVSFAGLFTRGLTEYTIIASAGYGVKKV